MMRRGALDSRLKINARLVREKDRARARELRHLFLCGAAIAVPLLVYVWQRVEFIRASYRVEELQKQKQDLIEMGKRMTVERSLLTAPDRIERVARRQLGLVDPHPEDVRRVSVQGGAVNEVGGPEARLPGGGPDPGAAAAGTARPEAGYVAASAGALPLPRLPARQAREKEPKR